MSCTAIRSTDHFNTENCGLSTALTKTFRSKSSFSELVRNRFTIDSNKEFRGAGGVQGLKRYFIPDICLVTLSFLVGPLVGQGRFRDWVITVVLLVLYILGLFEGIRHSDAALLAQTF